MRQIMTQTDGVVKYILTLITTGPKRRGNAEPACHWLGLVRVDMVPQFIGFGAARIPGGDLEKIRR